MKQIPKRAKFTYLSTTKQFNRVGRMVELLGQIFNNRNFNMVVPAFAIAFTIVAYKNPDEPLYTIGAIALSVTTVFLLIHWAFGNYRKRKFKKEVERDNKEEEKRLKDERRAQAIYAYEMLSNANQNLLIEITKNGKLAGYSNVFVFRDRDYGSELSMKVESMLNYNSNLYNWVKMGFSDSVFSVTIIEPLLEIIKEKMK